LILGLLLISASGCVTLGKFEAMEKRVETLKTHTEKLHEKNAAQDQMIGSIQSQLADAAKQIRRVDANTEASLEELLSHDTRQSGENESLLFQLQQAQKRIQQIVGYIERKFGTNLSDLPTNIPDNAADLYLLAESRQKGNQLKEAQALYQELLARYPDDENAVLAQFSIAQIIESKNDIEGAMAEYQKVYKYHKKHPKALDALLKIGDLLVSKRDCKRARKVYQLLQGEAPKSPQAIAAKEKIGNLKDLCVSK